MKILPIKDRKDIERIKNTYSKKQLKSQLLIFLLSINTGMKLTDILNLKVSALQGKNYINIDKKMTFILTNEIKELVKDVIKGKDLKDFVFTSNRNKQYSRCSIYKTFKDICAELNLYDYSVESWRKTFGYHYYKKYNDLFFLQWYFGQQTAVQTMAYIDVHESMSSRFKQGLEL